MTKELFEFATCYEYPDMESILDDGLESGAFYEYVGSSYLNGILPYLKPVRVVLLERYRESKSENPTDRPISDEEFEKILSQFHTKLGDFQDDVVFVGETHKYWWVLHCDRDVSDCCVGRVEKEKVTQEQLLRWAENYINPQSLDKPWKFLREIPVNRITGWITF